MRTRETILIGALAAWCSVASAGPARMRSPDGTIRSVPAESVDAARKQGYAEVAKVTMRAPDGRVVDVDEDSVAYMEGQGYWRMTKEEIDATREAEFREISASAERSHENDGGWDWREYATTGAVALLGVCILGLILQRRTRT